MPDRLMYDAVNVAAIPSGAQMVAGYVDGGYVTWPELVRRFPKARKVSITVTGDAVADVCDVERGDATPLKAVGWVRAMRTKGRRPIVYCSRDTVDSVVQACQAEREAPPFFWTADWTGEAHLTPGAVATQYSSPSNPVPGTPPSVDVSLVSPNWPDPVQKERPPVQLPPISWSTFYRLIALVGMVLGYIVAIGNQLHLPNSVRVAIAAAASGIAWIEHHKVTGATPPKPPTTPSA